MQTSMNDPKRRRLLDAAAGAYLACFAVPFPATRGELETLLEDAAPEFRNPIAEALWWCPFPDVAAAVASLNTRRS